MNILELEMLELLKRLKNEFGVFEIKAEYENEGSRQTELMRLKEISNKAGLPIILKIGGVEAITDMYNAIDLGVKGMIAPMAETAFATSKFLDAIDKVVPQENQDYIDFAINVETITAYENFDEMLKLEKINKLEGVTVGRVDFTASMGQDRSYANSEEMLKYCTEIFTKAKEKGLKTALGGAISIDSYEFINDLFSKGLIDKFETRKLVYNANSLANLEAALTLGIQFELLWLNSKRNRYDRMAQEDNKRIQMLDERMKKARAEATQQ